MDRAHAFIRLVINVRPTPRESGSSTDSICLPHPPARPDVCVGGEVGVGVWGRSPTSGNWTGKGNNPNLKPAPSIIIVILPTPTTSLVVALLLSTANASPQGAQTGTHDSDESDGQTDGRTYAEGRLHRQPPAHTHEARSVPLLARRWSVWEPRSFLHPPAIMNNCSYLQDSYNCS
jgi:hypothetical protein